MKGRGGRIRCRHCGRWGGRCARGLVHTCYRRLREAGRLDEYPPLHYRTPVRADTLLDEWEALATSPPEGTTHAEIAARLRMNPDALQRALNRARRDGDPRAVYLPHPRTGVRYDPTCEAHKRYRQGQGQLTEGGTK